MNSGNNVQKSLSGYVKDMDKYSRRIYPHFDAEDIHQFRTTTKKMRSLLRWQGVGKKVFPGSFVKSYHASGDLRNAQLLLIGLNEQSIQLPGFMLWLATEIGKHERGWKKTFRDSTIKKLEQNIAATKLQRPTVKSLQAFFNKKVEEMKQVINQPDPADEALHEIRKMMKDMLYLRQWCKKNWAVGWKATSNFSFVQLKKLAEVAGNYNDRSTGLLLLEAYLKQEKDAGYTRATKRVLKKHVQEASIFKEELKTALLEFTKKFK